MAIYHLSAKVISRSQGRSSVAAAAYRAGSKLHDERQGISFDYSRRNNVVYTNILAPQNAPAFVKDREALHNAIEAAEGKRKNAQLVREVEIALPNELTRDQQIELVENYAKRNFLAKGIVCDLCVHHNKDPENVHAHILLTLRTITSAGFGEKNRLWNQRTLLEEWREQWAIEANRYLKRMGHPSSIDHRSLAAQQTQARSQPKQIKEVIMNIRKQTLTPEVSQKIQQQSKTKDQCWIQLPGGIRPEWFRGLFETLEELMQRMADGKLFHIFYEPAENAYKVSVNEQLVITLRPEGIKVEINSDEAIAIAVATALALGWSQIILRGSDEFKAAAYLEALRQGFQAEDIGGYKPPKQVGAPTPLPPVSNRPKKPVFGHKGGI